MRRYWVALTLSLLLGVPALAPVMAQEDEPETIMITAETEPADYTIVDEEYQEVGRDRVVYRIALDPDADDEAKVAALSEVAQQGLDDHDDADVVIVFAAATAEEARVGGNVARAFLSRDGEGYTGDGGELLFADDDGRLQIALSRTFIPEITVPLDEEMFFVEVDDDDGPLTLDDIIGGDDDD